MVMLKAYFDESGHSSAPGYRPFAVGGCVAPLERWEIFEEEWKRILARFDVKCFHATDLAAYQGEFRDWNDARRKEFMGILVGLVRQYVARPVGAVLPLVAYRRLTEEQQAGLVDPYYICLQVCLEGAALEAASLPEEERVEVVFARAPGLVGKAADLFETFRGGGHPLGGRLGSISFASPADVIPLQAADLVAYELGKSIEGVKERWPMEELKKMNPYFQYLPYGRILEGF
jgi:hypothetical protein